MLTEPGEAFADFGFYVEYGQSLALAGTPAPMQLTFGPLIAKDIGRTTTTVNLFLTRELGPDQTHRAWISAMRHRPGGTYGRRCRRQSRSTATAVSSAARREFSQQQLRVGPVAIGALSCSELGLGKAGKVKYEIGWLFGATEATSQGTLRWRLEVEIPF